MSKLINIFKLLTNTFWFHKQMCTRLFSVLTQCISSRSLLCIKQNAMVFYYFKAFKEKRESSSIKQSKHILINPSVQTQEKKARKKKKKPWVITFSIANKNWVLSHWKHWYHGVLRVLSRPHLLGVDGA